MIRLYGFTGTRVVVLTLEKSNRKGHLILMGAAGMKSDWDETMANFAEDKDVFSIDIA